MRKITGLWKKMTRRGGEGGMTLLEVVVAMGILGGVVVILTFAMSTGMLTVRENDQEVTVQNLARNQMEYIKDLAFVPGASTYPAISVPPEYSIIVSVTSVPNTNSNIQKVTANISRNSNLLMSVSDYKVNR